MTNLNQTLDDRGARYGLFTGRIVNGDQHYADSWIDIAGYAKLVADRLEGITR